MPKTTEDLITEARSIVSMHSDFLWAQVMKELADKLEELIKPGSTLNKPTWRRR